MTAAGHRAKTGEQGRRPPSESGGDFSGYKKDWRNKNGKHFRLRAIRPSDREKMVRFHKSLSDETVYQRYFFPKNLSQRIEPDRLIRICSIDYDMEMVVVAESMDDPESGFIVGVSRLNRLGDGTTGEVAVLTVDSQQGQGLGKAMLRSILEIAQEKQMACLFVDILLENRIAQNLFRQLGFQIDPKSEDGSVRARLSLESDDR